MPDTERRISSARPAVGEVVEITWFDHFTFEGDDVPTRAVVARSWGKLVYEGEEGVAISQTDVIAHDPNHPVHNIHAGQFVARGSMREIKKAGFNSITKSAESAA